jgi:hypothetical protein
MLRRHRRMEIAPDRVKVAGARSRPSAPSFGNGRVSTISTMPRVRHTAHTNAGRRLSPPPSFPRRGGRPTPPRAPQPPPPHGRSTPRGGGSDDRPDLERHGHGSHAPPTAMKKIRFKAGVWPPPRIKKILKRERVIIVHAPKLPGTIFSCSRRHLTSALAMLGFRWGV